MQPLVERPRSLGKPSKRMLELNLANQSTKILKRWLRYAKYGKGDLKPSPETQRLIKAELARRKSSVVDWKIERQQRAQHGGNHV